MKATLHLQDDFFFLGQDDQGYRTMFDSKLAQYGQQAATPVTVTLEATAACAGMDVVAILQKKRRIVSDFSVEVEATRADTHPRVFESIHLHFKLTSPDATYKDLHRAIQLSTETYCPMVAMLRAAGVTITWDATLIPADTSVLTSV